MNKFFYLKKKNGISFSKYSFFCVQGRCIHKLQNVQLHHRQYCVLEVLLSIFSLESFVHSVNLSLFIDVEIVEKLQKGYQDFLVKMVGVIH